jgi:hypothetical protein
MYEMLESNQHPINLLFLELLKSLSLPAHPEQLYLHQLMIHFLTEGGHGLANQEQASRLRELLEFLDAESPESLMKWMKVSETLEPEDFEDLSPQESAQLAIQVLHQETAEQDETYP